MAGFFEKLKLVNYHLSVLILILVSIVFKNINSGLFQFNIIMALGSNFDRIVKKVNVNLDLLFDPRHDVSNNLTF